MERHVIVGAGTNGSQLATLLAERGEDVLVVSRRGRGPVDSRITLVACDAGDPAALSDLARGAVALYNCANPPYTAWETEWPPLAASLISAAESSGAVLVTLSNLYGYGVVDHPMVETDPLAATSDFFGPGLTDQGLLGERCVPRILAGKSVQGIGDPDAPHSWSYVPDVVTALALVATDERAYGRAWHVPTTPPHSLRQAVAALSAAAGVPAPPVRGLPQVALSILGLFSRQMAEMKEISYQFTAPFELDSSSFQETFGAEPTPFDDACAATVAWWRATLAP